MKVEPADSPRARSTRSEQQSSRATSQHLAIKEIWRHTSGRSIPAPRYCPTTYPTCSITALDTLTLPGKLVRTSVIASMLFLILTLATGLTLDLLDQLCHLAWSS